jgi:hypothetical protein
MKLLVRIVAVLAAASVISTLWFIASVAPTGGLRALATSKLGFVTFGGWLIALVAGPVAVVQLWRFRDSGRRAGIILFGYGVAYYIIGLLWLSIAPGFSTAALRRYRNLCSAARRTALASNALDSVRALRRITQEGLNPWLP